MIRLLAAIVVLGLIVFLLRLLAKGLGQTPKARTGGRTDPEMVVLHQTEAGSRNVKTLYEVFSWGREAMGEYLYYGEIDAEAVKADGTGDLSIARAFLQVDVNFEADVIDVATQTLRRCLARRYPAFSIESELDGAAIAEMTPTQISALVTSPDHISVVQADENSFSTFNVYGHFKAAFFEFNKIEDGRVIEVKVWAKDDGATVGWMYTRFLQLVDEYRDIPAQKFVGAIRE